MPGRLAAPQSLLDALFAHTNKLSHDDRQVILKFLSGDDMRANSSVSESQQSTYHSATTSADRRIGSMATTSNSSDILGQPQDLPPTIKQILLHEERRTETRPVPSSAASSDDNCTQMSTSEQLKTYTIVDQIIFEMDYSNGCWRKLRR